MTTARQRSWRVAVGPAEDRGVTKLAAWEGLRTTFKYSADADTRPNNLEISLYNLNDRSRAYLDSDADAPLLVLLYAGFGDEPPLRAVADIVDVEHKRDGVDRVTTIRAGEGERAYTDAHVSLSFRPGAKLSDIVGAIGASYDGVGIDFDRSQLLALPEVVRERGLSFNGRASAALSMLAPELAISPTVQAGSLVFLPREPETGPQSLVLTAETGLLGYPTREKKKRRGASGRWVISALLDYPIQPGAVVVVGSEELNGGVVVDEMTITGDSHGDEWAAELTVTPIEVESK